MVAADDLRTEIYPIVHGDAEALATYARVVVDDEGHVVLDAAGRRLIVVTTPLRHAQLHEVLGQADAQTPNVRVEVRMREAGATRDTRIGLEGGESGGAWTWRPQLGYETTRWEGETVQQLMAASGRDASLRVGERVPYLEWLMSYGWRGGYMESHVQWQEVGAFLRMTPTVLAGGESIHVRLVPELRGRVAGAPHQTSFIALATEVVVAPGQTVNVGGLAEDQDFYRRFLVGLDRHGTTQRLEIELTPHIVPVRSGVE